MEKDILDGAIGSVGSYDLEFKGGFLVAKAGVHAMVAGNVVEIAADLSIKIGSDAIIDALEKAIPGKIDDAVLEIVRQALKQ